MFEQYAKVRQITQHHCEPLQTEDYVPQPAEFASPPKWHLAHTTWFFEEMVLRRFVEGYSVFHPDFGFLFNSYYQTVGERAVRAQRGMITRPTVQEVYQYRQHVDEAMARYLAKPIPDEARALITLGLNHEQQHQELLLTDLKYLFSLNPTYPVYRSDGNRVADRNAEEGWVSVPEGIYEIGHDDDGFCFDNELERHKVYLQPYAISRALVTNGEYLAFMEAGGYAHFGYWLDEGWEWVRANQVQSPLYWHKIDDRWHHYTLAGLKPVDEEAILAHISYYEAHAFAHWKSLRLPTEFEWEAACPHLPWGKRWEWTASSYQPYPGFAIGDGAVGEYNGKFMVNQMVLRGASVATSEGHSRPTYRNFFHPFFQWQYSGIRLAK